AAMFCRSRPASTSSGPVDSTSVKSARGVRDATHDWHRTPAICENQSPDRVELCAGLRVRSWAREELNLRPHAYQAHKNISKVRHHAGIQRDRSPIRRHSSPSNAGPLTSNGHTNGHTTAV